MIRQLKYKILKNCTTQYIVGGRGGEGISQGANSFMRTLDSRRKLERGRGGKEKPFWIMLHSPFFPSFPFPCIACHACHAWPFMPSASILRRRL